jgi:hypothetical protein
MMATSSPKPHQRTRSLQRSGQPAACARMMSKICTMQMATTARSDLFRIDIFSFAGFRIQARPSIPGSQPMISPPFEGANSGAF